VTAFHWVDGERTIAFGRGKLADAPFLLGDPGYALLTTPRASAAAPAIVERAGAVHEVAPGRVDDLAADLRGVVRGELIVALGGGRVIDTAKALAAAAAGPCRVAAIPTTLSGAEMTAIHRQVAGTPAEQARRVRPGIVINDPQLSASQPARELAASAGNAIGHALEGPLTPLRNPVASQAALEATELIAAALGLGARAAGPAVDASDPGRDRLALGALLAGYVIGSTAYGLHHVLSQTLVRFASVGHGQANTIMLPHAAAALKRRFPQEVARFEEAAGSDAPGFAARLSELAGCERLRDFVDDQSVLERCADEAATRPELSFTSPAADREEILALYRAAW
jgi:alcohol dehydrogenase class IV